MTDTNSKAVQSSCKIDKTQINSFKDEVSRIPGIISINPKSVHEDIRYQLQNYLLIVYKSGKVVYHVYSEFNSILQKYSIDFIEKLPEEIITKDEQFFSYDLIIGQDEVGKGEMYGPMITGSVAIKPDQINEFKRKGIRDSKAIRSKTKIQELSQFIEQNAVAISVSRLYPKRFNELFKAMKEEDKNLNDLLAWQHSNALKLILEELSTKKLETKKILLIIDEFDAFKTDQRIKKLITNNIKVRQSTKAESLSVAVAAASIVAKDKRNTYVKKIEEKYAIRLNNSTVKSLVDHPESNEFLKLSFIKQN